MITGPQARELGLKIVFENPAGIGPTAIGQKILALHPTMHDEKGRPNGTIRGAVWDLDRRFPAQVRKTADGFAPIDGAAPALPERPAADSAPRASAKRARRPSASLVPQIAATKDMVIGALDDRIANLRRELDEQRQRAARLQAELDKGEPERIGVIAEADVGALVDIRLAVLAGSDESTVDAVRRVVDDLAKARAKLALTGIKDDAARLKAARKLAGVTQIVLGRKLGFAGRHTIDLIERGMTTLAKHEKVLRWVEKIEAKHTN